MPSPGAMTVGAAVEIHGASDTDVDAFVAGGRSDDGTAGNRRSGPHRGQALLQVGDQIIDVLQPDMDPHDRPGEHGPLRRCG